MKSFLRYLLTENTKLEVPLLPTANSTDARNEMMQDYYSLKPLSEPLVGFHATLLHLATLCCASMYCATIPRYCKTYDM